MAFTRRSYKPKGRKRAYRKRFSRKGMYRRSRRSGTQKLVIKRTWPTYVSYATTTAAPSFVSWKSTIADLPNYTELTTLFDKYKINGVKIDFFQPYQNGAGNMDSSTSASQQRMPMIRLHTVHDYDDNSAIGISDMMQYPSYKCIELTSANLKNGKYSRYTRPAILRSVYETLVSTGYESVKRHGYLDSSSTDVAHYHTKAIFEPVYADGTPAFWDVKVLVTINMTYYLSLRDPR
jgi:hypothetical protein